jgi:hypothetical protein
VEITADAYGSSTSPYRQSTWFAMVKLPDPRDCPICGNAVRVRLLETRTVKGYIRRRRRCSTCKQKWNSYETIINPHDLPVKVIETHYR